MHRAPSARPTSAAPHRSARGLTLVETMVALTLAATVMVTFLGSFLQSRRMTESSVLRAAATAQVYGLIEQIKQLDYSSVLPNYEVDPAAPNTIDPPYIRLRLNQNDLVWVRVVHTAETDEDASTTTIPYPKGPTTTPAIDATATSVGAIDNSLGDIPLSTVTGTTSQKINLNLWVWIDEIANRGVWAGEATQPVPDATNVKVITIVYTYSYQDGNMTRTVRDREVIVRTRFDQ